MSYIGPEGMPKWLLPKEVPKNLLEDISFMPEESLLNALKEAQGELKRLIQKRELHLTAELEDKNRQKQMRNEADDVQAYITYFFSLLNAYRKEIDRRKISQPPTLEEIEKT